MDVVVFENCHRRGDSHLICSEIIRSTVFMYSLTSKMYLIIMSTPQQNKSHIAHPAHNCKVEYDTVESSRNNFLFPENSSALNYVQVLTCLYVELVLRTDYYTPKYKTVSFRSVRISRPKGRTTTSSFYFCLFLCILRIVSNSYTRNTSHFLPDTSCVVIAGGCSQVTSVSSRYCGAYHY